MKDPTQVSHGKDYVYSKNLSNSNQVVYVQRVTNGSIYSTMGEVRFTIQNGEITSYTQGYLSDVAPLREKPTQFPKNAHLFGFINIMKFLTVQGFNGQN